MTTNVTFKASAVDLRRTCVPEHTSVTVQHGLAMCVDSDFTVDGELLLDGELKVLNDD